MIKPAARFSSRAPFLVRDLLWPAVALTLGVMVTLWLMNRDRAANQAAAGQRFSARAAEIAEAILDRFLSYELALRGGRGLFFTADVVTRSDWRRYVTSLDLERTSPGTRGIGYARWTLPSEVAAVEGSAQAEGVLDFRMHPLRLRDAYALVYFLEPNATENGSVLGFDMWAEPVRRAALQAARDTGGAIVSSAVTLFVQSHKGTERGFLMCLPHYATSETPKDLAGRRAALKGFVYSPLRMRDFMRGIDPNGWHDIRLQLFDGVDAQDSIFDSRPNAADAAFAGLTETTILGLPGHVWTARFSAVSADDWQPPKSPIGIAGGGALVTLLVFGIVFLSGRARRVVELNARLGRIVDDSVSEIFVFDARRLLFLQVSRGARENLGYGMAELRTLTPVAVAPRFTAPTFEALLKPLREGREEEIRLETTLRRRDGSSYEAEVSLQLSKTARPPVFIAFVQDISERRRSEMHQRLLMDELNHRVKNTLAVVQTIAARTLHGTGSAEEFSKAFSRRLGALGVSHTLLTATYWSGAELSALVREHLAPFRAGIGRVSTEGPAIVLKPPAALALGLALHELATNAAKYGSLSVPTGSLAVTWRIVDSEGDPRLELNWVEGGGPVPPPDPGRGFGRTVIERGLSYELDGNAELRFEPTGLRCRIEIPLSSEIADLGREAT